MVRNNPGVLRNKHAQRLGRGFLHGSGAVSALTPATMAFDGASAFRWQVITSSPVRLRRASRRTTASGVTKAARAGRLRRDLLEPVLVVQAAEDRRGERSALLPG